MTKTAVALEGFKALSDENKEWLKSVEELGWIVEFDSASKTWSASKDGYQPSTGETSFGPFDSFMLMMNIIEKEENDRGKSTTPEAEILTHDAKGQGYLPGNEVVAVPELIDLGKRRVEIVGRHKKATQELIEINEDILNAAEKFPQHFTTHPVSGSRIYKAAGVEIEIEHTEKDKVKTRLDSEDDDTNPTPSKKGVKKK